MSDLIFHVAPDGALVEEYLELINMSRLRRRMSFQSQAVVFDSNRSI